MSTIRLRTAKFTMSRICILTATSLFALSSAAHAFAASAEFGPSNPLYAASTLPFQAPPFDKIKDTDYQPAIEAGMAQQLQEMKAIADNPAPPTFENTLVAMEKTGQLFTRAMMAFSGVTGANMNPGLEAAVCRTRHNYRERMGVASAAIFVNLAITCCCECSPQQVASQ